MPTRAHRPTLARTHSRSSSGGSNKVVLNLQLTQKDPVLPKIDKARRTSHTFEPAGRANVLRTGSTVRVQSREHVPSAAPRRAVTNPLPPRGGKPKAGFTIAASTVGSDDEDEWVSSESGAATPLDDASGDEGSGKKTPQEQQSAATTPVDPTGNGQNAAFVPSTTPRAESTQPRPRVQTNGFTVRQPPVTAPTARIPSPSKPPHHSQQEQEPYRQQQPKHPSPQPTDAPQIITQQFPLQQQLAHPPPRILDQRSPTSPPRTPEPVPHVSGARTEPPTPTSPRSDRHSSGKARPASTRSLIADHSHAALRPHPLIRGQSFGHGHLAPLKVTPDAAQARTRTSQARFSVAPRRPSARSVSTLPVMQQPLTPVERARTTSTLSTTSSSTAFSSLAHFPTTRGSSAAAAAAAAAVAVATAQTPPLVVHFPSQNAHAPPETVHTLLPPPYVTPHFTILQWRSPIQRKEGEENHREGRPEAASTSQVYPVSHIAGGGVSHPFKGGI
ncbi:hypothetical protein BJY52DRAFT_1418674 [Lactarius psammicola]|nr:hypothetical protein BJY52DRAFT_1418674 [Lactarius psammicola]